MFKIKRITAEVTAGDDITQTCRSAIELANKYSCMVIFDFNGITIMVESPAWDLEGMVESYNRALEWKRRQSQQRGPIHAF